MNTAIQIHTLGVADYEAICHLWEMSGVQLQRTGRESLESFTRQMNGGTQTVLGAYEGEALVGVALVTHDGRKGWINRLGILPNHQRKGIGTALVKAAETLLHDMGLTIVAALVEHHNEASLKLFQRAGYQVNATYYLTKRDHPNA
jgi:N-acetylglutamate synthase